MADEGLKGFFKKVMEDGALQEKLKALSPDQVDEVVKIGAENGFTFTADDVKNNSKPVEAGEGEELSDDELEQVAGGAWGWGTCCFVGLQQGF